MGCWAARNSNDELDELRPILFRRAMLGAGDQPVDAVSEVLAQIVGGRQKRRVLTEEGEHRLSHALDQLFGQAGDGLGVVAAGGVRQPQQTIEAGQADGLAEPQEPLAVQMEDLVEEPAQIVPMFVRERHTRLGRLLAEVLPVAPAAQVFQVPKRRERRVGEHECIDPVGIQHGRVHRDHAAETVADKHRPIDLEGVHDRQRRRPPGRPTCIQSRGTSL